MSREIKFRAYSNEHNRYCDFVTLDENGRWIGWIKSSGIYLTTADSILEQYTGLKDKNGKEIYENCELDGRYRVEYIAPKFVCKDIINGDIIELYDNKFTITKEHCEISQNSERGIN